MPMSCLMYNWKLRNRPPSGFSTCSKMSFSPKANTGTSEAPVRRAILMNPLRRESVSVASPGRASKASAAPPMTMATLAPGARVRFLKTLIFVTLLTPSAINTSLVNGNLKFTESVSRRRSNPGKAL